MLSALKKYLLVPKLVRLSAGAPRDQRIAWDRFWSTVKATGAGGDVLWDSGSDREMKQYVHMLRLHLDTGLPVVDIGCGNGSFTRQLAGHFPDAVGVDVSANAVQRARTESAGMANVSYTVRDMTAPGAGAGLMDELPVLGGEGGANAFIRGVFHVLPARDRLALAENVRAITGANGRVFLAETDFQGNALDYVAHLGATFRSIPGPLQNAIQGLPVPGRFGPKERTLAFPATHWELIEDGPTTLETVPLSHPTQADLIPGYFAVLKARTSRLTRDQAG